MINVTDKAIEKVKGFLEQEKASLPGGGLRIFVQGGGCSGVSYGMVLDEAAAGDEVFETQGLKVIVDPNSLPHLEGAEVDYKDDQGGGGFAIKNPNAAGGCGDSCGSNGGSRSCC
jgi:iron-sulfur cluster assembly accessory protein